jgi:hypothetical protein
MDKEQRDLARALLDRTDRAAKAAEQTAAVMERLTMMLAQIQGTMAAILKVLEERR